MNLAQELGFRTHQGTDCEWSSCGRDSTHFHCRSCGYGTSQVANIISHRRICISYSDHQQKDFSRLTPSSDSSSLQYEVTPPTQPYSYYSSNGSTASLSPQSNSPGCMNSKLVSTQQSTMFNFVLPSQNSQYSALYSSQSVIPSPNLFSPSSFNNFGQLDSPWLPQSRLIPPSLHCLNSASDLLGTGKGAFEKLESSNSPSCCGRYGTIETTNVGMCSPLTAEAYRVVSKEFQTKIDSQNRHCNSPSVAGFNGQQSSCKYSDSASPFPISLFMLESNDQKQILSSNYEQVSFENSKIDKKNVIKKCIEDNFTECMEITKIDESFNSNTGEKRQNEASHHCTHIGIIHEARNELDSLSVSEESEIIVEESDSDSLQLSSITKLTSRCLVCNRQALDESVKLNNEIPVTTATHVSILQKLSQVVDDDKFNKLKDCSICLRCLNLINVVDQLEIKLKSAKKQLIDIYKTKDKDNGEEIISNSEEKSLVTTFKNKLMCDVCNKTFSSINYLEKHKQCHTKTFSYYCEYCGKGFAVLQSLQNHIVLHSNSSRYQCELCGHRFIQKQNLVDHINKHKGEYRYQCPVCKKGFIRRSVFKTHTLGHTSDSLICQHCGKQFKNSANLSVHIKICSGDLKFGCDKCEKKFPIRSLLKKHISIRHNSEYHFVCGICTKGFGKKSDLRAHMHSHSDNKPFKCSMCNNCYKSLSNLNQHLKVHSSDTVLECHICRKKFTRQDCLTDHLNQHTGNRPYKCTLCWKTFANRINFNIHIKRHNGTLKKKPCPICGKLFNKGLKDHLISHSGQKPYSCKHCIAVFTVKSSLNKHMKSKHNLL